MSFLVCSFRLESPGWSICRHPGSIHHNCRVKPASCEGCLISGGTALEIRSPPPRPSQTPSQGPQEAHGEPPEITPLGHLIYRRTGWEPPPTPPGYRAQSSDPNDDGAWVLEPMEPICKHLELVPAETGSCGYRRVAKRCKLVQSFIGQRTCKTCPKQEC